MTELSPRSPTALYTQLPVTALKKTMRVFNQTVSMEARGSCSDDDAMALLPCGFHTVCCFVYFLDCTSLSRNGRRPGWGEKSKEWTPWCITLFFLGTHWQGILAATAMLGSLVEDWKKVEERIILAYRSRGYGLYQGTCGSGAWCVWAYCNHSWDAESWQEVRLGSHQGPPWCHTASSEILLPASSTLPEPHCQLETCV